MPTIGYYSKNMVELGRSDSLGCATLFGLAFGLGVLFLGFVHYGLWAILLAAAILSIATLGLLQGLFDVSIILADSQTLVIRQYFWGRLDEELTFPISDLDQFEIERRVSETAPLNGDAVEVRIVARMKSGRHITLDHRFSSGLGAASNVDQLNRKLAELRGAADSKTSR